VFHVKHDSLIKFIGYLENLGIQVSESQQDCLALYRDLILSWSARFNLISHGDRSLIVERHFSASVYFVKLISDMNHAKKSRIMDLGTGAGFPGVLLSIFLDNEITLLDSSRKKTLFLQKVIDQLKLPARILNERVENLDAGHIEKYDIITARAVSNLNNLISWTYPLLTRKGRLITVKGDDYKNEITSENNELFSISRHPVEQSWIHPSNNLSDKVFIILEKKSV